MAALTYRSANPLTGDQTEVSALTPLPVVLAGSSAANPNANPAALYTDQQAVTASAVALTAQVLVNGLVLKAKSTNAGKVFVGGSNTVTTTDDGSGAGWALAAGESVSIPVTNTSAVFIIGTASDVVYVLGN